MTTRLYQEELSRNAKEGRNTVIYTPAGSGKTYVARDVLKHHLEQGTTENKCVLYLVNSLLRKEKILQVLSPAMKCGEYHGSSGDEVSLKRLMVANDVIIMTPQVLLNLLEAPEVGMTHQISLGDISMLVFDECHRATKKHCYNEIMQYYLKDLCEDPPQVVGLTSTLNVGEKEDMKRAKTTIETICAHLDAEALSVVSDLVDELLEFVNLYPIMDEVPILPREDDQCCTIIGDHMKKIHERMNDIRQSEEITGPKKKRLEQSLSKMPQDVGSHTYNRWIKKLKFSVSTIKNCPQKTELFNYTAFLIMYNQALIINAQVRTQDALFYLRDELGKLQEHLDDDNRRHSVFDWLLDTFKELETTIEATLDDPRFENPLLRTLKAKITEFSGQHDSSRGVIFVEAREAPQRLRNWLAEDEDLRGLEPIVLTPGSGIVDEFLTEGKHKVFITSMADRYDREKIAIPKCTWVIRVLYSSGKVELTEVKGGDPSTLWPHSELIWKGILNRAALDISKMTEEEFTERMTTIQDEESSKRQDIEYAEAAKKYAKATEFHLKCLGCDVQVSESTELRLHCKNHRTSVRHALSSLYIREPLDKPIVYRDVKIPESIRCKKCRMEWGKFGRVSELWMPILKPEGFVFNAGTDKRTYREWKQVPVNISTLSAEECDLMRGQYGSDQ